MDIKSVGAYSLGFLVGASGIGTVVGLSVSLYCAIKALVYKILLSTRGNVDNFLFHNRQINRYIDNSLGGLILAIPIVGGIFFVHHNLNEQRKPKIVAQP